VRILGTALLLALLAAAASADGDPPAAPAAKGPHIVFDRTEQDFGVVAQETELHTEFTYRNDGDQPLTGIRALADCGCYDVTPSLREVPPGGAGTLKVSFRTLLFAGPLTKKISFRSNDPKEPDVTLHLHILVGQGVVLDPGRVYFGDVLLGDKPSMTFDVKWLDGVGRPFQVTGVEIPGHQDDFQIDLAPFEKKQKLEQGTEGLWRGTRVTIAFKTAPPLGMFSSTALVRTDHPDYPRLAVPLTAAVSGHVWLQSRVATFGYVLQGESRRSTISIRPFSKDVDLGAVSVKVRGGKVEAKVEPDPNLPKGNYRLTVSVPETAKPGTLDDVVELHTAVKGEEVVEIAVRGEVLPRGG
jgi:hypothetical protein